MRLNLAGSRLARLLSRAAALALLLAVLAGAAQLLVAPVWAHIEGLRGRIEQERLMLGRLAALSSGQAELSNLDTSLKAARSARYFLDGDSDAIRLANLQSLLTALAAKAGVQLRSTRNVPARERNDLRLIGIQLQLGATLPQLQALLVDIEAQVPDLYVEALHVTPAASALGPRAENAGALEVRLEVAGATPKPKA